MGRCFDYIGGHEKNFSAESSEACKQARFSVTDGNPGRPQGDCASPGARTRPTDRQRPAVRQVSGSTRTRAPSFATPSESEASQVDSGAFRSVPARQGIACRRMHPAGVSRRKRCGSIGSRPSFRWFLAGRPHSGRGQAESNQASSTRMLQTGAWRSYPRTSWSPGGAYLDGCLPRRRPAFDGADQGGHESRRCIAGFETGRIGLSYLARRNG